VNRAYCRKIEVRRSSGIAFGLNPNSSETEADFQVAAEAEAKISSKSSGGTSKAVNIGVSIGVIIFALLVGAALAVFLIRRPRKAQSAASYEVSDLDHYAADHKDCGQAEIKPPVPPKNYELATNGDQNRRKTSLSCSEEHFQGVNKRVLVQDTKLSSSLG
jgi:hypothetical protein